MKVEFLTSAAGDDFAYRRGEIVDLPPRRAKGFIAAGIAKPARGQRRETAVPPERSEKADDGKAAIRPPRSTLIGRAVRFFRP